MNPPKRIGFAGTPEFATAILAGLIGGGYKPVVVYSQPPRPRGRGRRLVPSPVAELASSHGIRVETPRSLRKADAQQTLAGFELDLLIVAAYGLILPSEVLRLPTLGCLNVHASLLPRWRGAAPIERAILAGDHESGIALMQMDEGLDTGPVHSERRVEIGPSMTAGDLEEDLARAGIEALLELLPRLPRSEPLPQSDNGACYAHKLSATDSLIRWDRPAVELERQVRGLMPRQPATATRGDLRLRVLAAAVEPSTANAPPGTVLALDKQGLLVRTADAALRLLRIQLNRGKGAPLDGAALRNGYGKLLEAGTRLDLLETDEVE